MPFIPKQFYSILKLTSLLLTFFLCSQLYAQAKIDTAKSSKLIFIASLGFYTGTAKALSSDVKRLMTVNPIVKVKDAKGVEYKVVAFEVTWKRKEISDDIKSGKPKAVYYMVGADVKTNQLPEIFRQQISTGLQAGEEIMLSNILYNDPKKKINYKASNSIVLNII